MAPVKKAKADRARAFTKSSKSSKSRKARETVTTKPGSLSNNALKKKRRYTDAQLGVPTLNMVTPAGVQKPRGKKKGKVFVDDQESLVAILAMVNAEKEGNIESKMARARAMEEVREAKRREAERRAEGRREKLEDVKDSLRKRRNKKKQAESALQDGDAYAAAPSKSAKSKKRVSFG